MAIVRTGNSPVCTRDIGPAAAGIDGLSAMGRLSALRVPGIDVAGVAVGAGPIERRTESPQERAARQAPVNPGSPWRRYRSVQFPTLTPPSRPEEDTVTPTTAPPAIPCDTCLHAPVCRLRDLIPAMGHEVTTPVADGLRLVSASLRIECDHQLSGATMTRIGPRVADMAAASRRNGTARSIAVREAAGTIRRHPSKAGEATEKAKRAADALAALERHGGDRRAAAAELGIRGNAFAMIVKHAQRQAVGA